MQVPAPTASNTMLIAIWKVAISFLAGIIVFTPIALKVLVWVLIFDVFLSILNKHAKFRDAIVSAANAFIFSAGTHFLYLATKEQGLNFGVDFDTVVSTWFIVQSIVSIVLNLCHAGLRMPPAVFEWLSNVNGITAREKQQLEALKLRQSQELTALSLKQDQDKADN